MGFFSDEEDELFCVVGDGMYWLLFDGFSMLSFFWRYQCDRIAFNHSELPDSHSLVWAPQYQTGSKLLKVSLTLRGSVWCVSQIQNWLFSCHLSWSPASGAFQWLPSWPWSAKACRSYAAPVMALILPISFKVALMQAILASCAGSNLNSQHIWSWGFSKRYLQPRVDAIA